MKKKLLGILALFCLLSTNLFGALAQTTKPKEIPLFFYDPDDGFCVTDILLLSDGKALLCGYTVTKTNNTGSADVLQHYDACAVLLDAENQPLWEYKESNSQQSSDFQAAWLTSTGLIALKYLSDEPGIAPKILLLNKSGEKCGEQELNNLIDIGVAPESLTPVKKSFIVGGFELDDGVLTEMHQQSTVAYLDMDMRPLWKLQDERMNGGVYNTVRFINDAFYFGGWISRVDQGFQTPSIMRVSKNGKIDWQYVGNKYAVARVNDVYPLSDGGVLFCTDADPTVPTSRDQTGIGAVTRLNGNGQVVWSKEYQSIGFITMYAIYPFHEGFLVSGYTHDGKENDLVYINDDGQVLGRAILPIRIEDEQTYLFADFKGMSDGSVYLYGLIGTTNNQLRAESEPVIRSFFTELSLEMFQ